MRSAARSAIITVGAWVWPRGYRVGAYPVLSGSFSSPRRRRPSSAHAARNADVVGLGSRSSEMNCGPEVPYTRPVLLPTRRSASLEVRQHVWPVTHKFTLQMI
jgi:hypothetical protein